MAIWGSMFSDCWCWFLALLTTTCTTGGSSWGNVPTPGPNFCKWEQIFSCYCLSEWKYHLKESHKKMQQRNKTGPQDKNKNIFNVWELISVRSVRDTLQILQRRLPSFTDNEELLQGISPSVFPYRRTNADITTKAATERVGQLVSRLNVLFFLHCSYKPATEPFIFSWVSGLILVSLGLCPELSFFHVRLDRAGSGDLDLQRPAAGITDQGDREMGTKPVRLGPDRVCLWRLCGGGWEQLPAFLWLPSCLLSEHDYMCHSLGTIRTLVLKLDLSTMG